MQHERLPQRRERMAGGDKSNAANNFSAAHQNGIHEAVPSAAEGRDIYIYIYAALSAHARAKDNGYNSGYSRDDLTGMALREQGGLEFK